LAGNVVKKQTKTKNGRKMADKNPKNGRKMTEKKPKKRRDEAPISIDYTAHFARKFSKMELNSRKQNETKMALLKRKER
jgi:hypothetical protein